MSDRSGWEKSVGTQAEASVTGSTAHYPLLGDERLDETESPSKGWWVKVLVRESYSESERSALSEGVGSLEDYADRPEGQKMESLLPVSLIGDEARVEVDLQVLRNIAEIRRLKAARPDILRWTLVCEGKAGDDPEVLVGETLRQLTGVLAGCDTLEIVQGVGEPFNGLWSRVNVARLMASEGELGQAPDALSGSGFFAELQSRLAVSIETEV